MYVNVHVGGQGWSCYVCNKGISDRDMFQIPDLPSPYQWVCSTCLGNALMNGLLVIRVPDAETENACDDCGDIIEPGSTIYCQSCRDQAYESGESDSVNA